MSKKPLCDYVELPPFEEYKEWFGEFFDLKREDGILEVCMKTGDGPMYWSGAAHRAMSQLSRIISMDHDNEILIWTHKGDSWMMDMDPNGWERYNSERFDHQYFDDTNLIKNMIFDLEIPTIGAVPGPGFHWDSAVLCDITLASEDAKFDDHHVYSGKVAGDAMGLLMQYFTGTKRANYYLYTGRVFTAQEALDWGFISEICPKGTVLDRAWELARMIKTVPRQARTMQSYLCKRPLERLLVEDLKINNLSEMASTLLSITDGNYGSTNGLEKGREVGEGDMSLNFHYRLTPGENDYMTEPIHDWDAIREDGPVWAKKYGYKLYTEEKSEE